jgi:hypothetical protein
MENFWIWLYLTDAIQNNDNSLIQNGSVSRNEGRQIILILSGAYKYQVSYRKLK